MLRKNASTTLPDGTAKEPTKPLTHEEIVEERLDLIVQYLHRAEKRDRWRTVGSTVRGIIAIVPLLVFLGSLWYVYVYGEDLLQKITATAAKQAAEYSQDSMGNFLDQFQQYVPGGTKN